MATRGRKPDDIRRQAVALLRAQGLSFTEIGTRLGIRRQCAQQLLKASGHSVDLPGICCIGCGTVIVKGRGPWLHNGPVYCLVCLAKTPEAPFGQRLKAHRLAAGLTLRRLGELVGTAGTYLGNLEQGRKRPLWSTIVKPIRVFGLALVDADNELAAGMPKRQAEGTA